MRSRAKLRLLQAQLAAAWCAATASPVRIDGAWRAHGARCFATSSWLRAECHAHAVARARVHMGADRGGGSELSGGGDVHASPDLPARFARALEEGELVRMGATVVALVSGGSDSVALLHLLAGAREALDLRLHVLHFNHGTRTECDAEEAFVAELAAAHDARLHVRRLEAAPSSGLQARTRAWRRAEAVRLLDALGVGEGAAGRDGVIALAHHKDDDEETILLKWLRGCHATRLRGMRARSGPFVRPLLGERKAALTAWLRARGLAWMEDGSNAQPTYKRNRVRLELVPLLRELTGGALSVRLEHAVAQAQEARSLLEECAAPAATRCAVAGEPGALDVRELLGQPRAVQTELLHGFLARAAGRAPSYSEVRRVLQLLRAARASKPQRTVQLAGGCALELCGGRLRAARAGGAERGAPAGGAAERAQPVPPPPTPGPAQPAITIAARAHLWRVAAAHDATAPLLPPPARALTLYNVPAGARLRVRARRDGDRFHPAWRERPIKLKDFLRGQRLRLHERSHVPLLTRVTAAPGAGAAVRAEAGGATGGRAGEAAEVEEVVAVFTGHVARAYAEDGGERPPLHVAVEPATTHADQDGRAAARDAADASSGKDAASVGLDSRSEPGQPAEADAVMMTAGGGSYDDDAEAAADNTTDDDDDDDDYF